MLTFMPLLIEIALLAATAYLYWLTRQLLGRHRAENGGEDQVDMMQNVAALLDEWQTAASAARDESLRQQTHLQETSRQAERTISELRFLVAQAQTPQEPAATVQAKKGSHHDDLDSFSASLPATLAQAILDFSKHLRGSDYSPAAVIRAASRSQHFVAWLEAQNSVQVPLRPIRAGEIENYRRSLMLQPVRVDLDIEREMATIKDFAYWVNDLCDFRRPPDVVELNRSVPVPPAAPRTSGLAGKMPLIEGADRYRNVFVLANQGLDLAGITAQTGLEREAVHLLLSVGPASHLKQ